MELVLEGGSLPEQPNTTKLPLLFLDPQFMTRVQALEYPAATPCYHCWVKVLGGGRGGEGGGEGRQGGRGGTE